MRTELPFGPFLAAAAVFYLFAEPWIVVNFRFPAGEHSASRCYSGGVSAEQIIAGVVLSERLAVTMYGAIHRAQFSASATCAAWSSIRRCSRRSRSGSR